MNPNSFHEGTTLLTEHLQYTPLSLIDDIINAVNGYVYQAINNLETGLNSTSPARLGFKPTDIQNGTHDQPSDFLDAKQEIEEGLHKLETLLSATIDKNFDVFEIYVLRNILTVPEDLINWIQLKHYEGIPHPHPVPVPLVEDLQALRERLAASRSISRALSSECNRNKAALQQLRGLLNTSTEIDAQPNVSFLTTALSETAFSGQQPITANTKFTLSQLPALKANLAMLKEKASTLQQIELSNNTAKDELREERRRYIETTTEAHLIRNGHSQIHHSGPLAGKQPDLAEIEGIESAAKALNPP